MRIINPSINERVNVFVSFFFLSFSKFPGKRRRSLRGYYFIGEMLEMRRALPSRAIKERRIDIARAPRMCRFNLVSGWGGAGGRNSSERDGNKLNSAWKGCTNSCLLDFTWILYLGLKLIKKGMGRENRIFAISSSQDRETSFGNLFEIKSADEEEEEGGGFRFFFLCFFFLLHFVFV